MPSKLNEPRGFTASSKVQLRRAIEHARFQGVRAGANGEIVGHLPELVEAIARSDASDGGQRVPGGEGRRAVVARAGGNTGNADDVGDVKLRTVGGAEEFVLEEAMPAGANFVHDRRRKDVRSVRLGFCARARLPRVSKDERGNRVVGLNVVDVAAVERVRVLNM